MPVRVGINGFGRIGRNIMRAALGDRNIDFVAVNDLTTPATLAHLLKYDSIHGNLDMAVDATSDSISVAGDTFKVLSKRDPGELPWKELGGGVVDDSDVHRRGLRRGRSAAGTQGQARRLRDARADAERLGRRSRGDARQEDDGGGSERGVEGGGGRPDEGHPGVFDGAARVD